MLLQIRPGCQGKYGRLLAPRTCSMGNVYRFVEPVVLLLLKKKGRSYGYDLGNQLKDYAIMDAGIERAALYRTLRHLEENGNVVSEWDTGRNGPARRVYRLTRKGEGTLRNGPPSWTTSRNRWRGLSGKPTGINHANFGGERCGFDGTRSFPDFRSGIVVWRARRDSNPRPTGSKVELFNHFRTATLKTKDFRSGSMDQTRTKTGNFRALDKAWTKPGPKDCEPQLWHLTCLARDHTKPTPRVRSTTTFDCPI
jgi:DNA-binding PadR family transcriptional regulator